MAKLKLTPFPEGPLPPDFPWDRKPWERDFIDIPKLVKVPCKIKMLIVVDGGASFGSSCFGLSHFLKSFNDPAPFTTFSITKAHRGNSTSSDINNFKFDNHNLHQYDVIWLFGVHRTEEEEIALSEVKAIVKYMDRGGGLFATGDHEDLGVSMCGKIPRVRSMRRWYYNYDGGFGEPTAPPQFPEGDIFNHFTIEDDPTTPLNEELGNGIFSQGDRYPQSILPKYYYNYSLWQRRLVKFPHPVFCGRNGVIKVFPDHMHEGVCEIPYELNRKVFHGGLRFEEYPKDKNGVQVVPEIIAKATNKLNNETFGLVAIFDGHRTSAQGRVLTDSTWHHFFNVNLNGFETARRNLRVNGSNNPLDAESDKWYSDIQDYFRNIAYWLARRKTQNCMRNKGMYALVFHADINIAITDLKLVKNKNDYFFNLGIIARDALNQLASRCQSLAWIFTLLPSVLNHLNHSKGTGNIKIPSQFIDKDHLTMITFGANVHEIFLNFQKRKKLSSKDFIKMEKICKTISERVIKDYIKQNMSELKQLLKSVG
jgi:hypothetical protein